MHPADPSDALLAALSRAAALSQYRLAPWPPASEPALDRDALAENLQRTHDIGRGHDLAIVALAEAGEQLDPDLRAELTAHARDEFADADLSEWSDSVGAALQRRVFDGLRVGDGARALQVDWLRAHISCGRGRVHLAIRVVDGETVQRARAELPLPTNIACALPLAADWHARAESALRSALAGGLLSPDAIGESLLQSLLPDTINGRAAWLLTRGVELLSAHPLAEVELGDTAYSLSLQSVTHETHASSYGAQRWLLRLVIRESSEIRDIYEREIWAGGLAPDDYREPAPIDDSLALAAIEAWRAATRDYLARDDLELDPEFFFNNFLAEARPLALLATWLADGPPGPPPATAPRIHLDDRRLADAATRVRLLDESETDALRETVDDQLLAALELDGWLALFCPCHRPALGTFQADRIQLRPPGGEPITILMSDPWNGHVMPIDGDAALFRAIARFWRELLDRAGLDVAFTLPRDADDDDEYDEYDPDDGSTTLRAWLEFPLPDPTPPFPRIDWRVYDGERDFIADFSFWASGPFAMPHDLRDMYEAAIATHYHAHVRAVIDPDLAPRPADPLRP